MKRPVYIYICTSCVSVFVSLFRISAVLALFPIATHFVVSSDGPIWVYSSAYSCAHSSWRLLTE